MKTGSIYNSNTELYLKKNNSEFLAFSFNLIDISELYKSSPGTDWLV